MFLYTDYATPPELTGFARASVANLEINRFTLSSILPSQFIDDLDYRFTRGGEGLIEAATFRAYDAEAPIAARPGLTRSQGELPAISRKIPLGEYERLKQRANPDQAIRDAIFGDVERLTRAIAARFELARGDALVNGKVTIAENGVSGTVDYGRNAGNYVTAATYWTDVANATPVQNMLGWAQAYRDITGAEMVRAITAKKNMALLMRNAEIKGLAYPATTSAALVRQSDVAGVMDSFGLPKFEFYDAQVRVAGVATRVIPDNVVIFLPGASDLAQLGRVLWGTTAESLEPGYGLAGDEPGIVAGNMSTWDPVAVWTKAAAIGVPVLANPNLVFVAKIAA